MEWLNNVEKLLTIASKIWDLFSAISKWVKKNGNKDPR